MRVLAIICAVVWGGTVAAQQAASPEARAHIETQIAAACEDRGGRFTSGVYERDLTGDGQADLILDHGGIECNGDWRRSGFCGAQVCSVYFYVRNGQALNEVKEMLGIVQSISSTPVPLIGIYAHGGPVFQWRWNGTTFLNIGE